MMERQIALGVPWAGLLLDRLKGALKSWSIRSGAQSDTEMARSATALMPFGMGVKRGLRASSRRGLVQPFGVSSDGIDRALMCDLGIPSTNAPSEMSGLSDTLTKGAITLILAGAQPPSVRQDNVAVSQWN